MGIKNHSLLRFRTSGIPTEKVGAGHMRMANAAITGELMIVHNGIDYYTEPRR